MKPEARLQRDVIELARRLNFMAAHFRAAQVREGKWATPVGADGAGFPDLVLVGWHNVLYVELKDRHGRLSDAQRRWLAALERAGQDVYVWRPADWDSRRRRGDAEAAGAAAPLRPLRRRDGRRVCVAHGGSTRQRGSRSLAGGS